MGSSHKDWIETLGQRYVIVIQAPTLKTLVPHKIRPTNTEGRGDYNKRTPVCTITLS